MIERIWHGYTLHEKADTYESLLHDEIFPGIETKGIPGYLGIKLLRRDMNSEVEFITIMRFSSLEEIRNFTGDEYSRAYVPAKAKKLLKRYDEYAQHYEVRQEITY